MAPSPWDASSWMPGPERGNYLQKKARIYRKNQTPAESELWSILRAGRCGGWKFSQQQPLGKYIVDFYCAELKIAIEVDGAAHSSHWRQKMDRQRQENLERKGVRFLRFTNYDIWRNLAAVRQYILGYIDTIRCR